MQVKRFNAPSMRRALQLVRDELGADAVILSSKRIEDGIEVMAAAASAAAPEPMLTAIEPIKATRVPESRDQRLRLEPSPLEIELERVQRQARERAAEFKREMRAAQELSVKPSTDQRPRHTERKVEVEAPVLTSTVEELQRRTQESDKKLTDMHKELQQMRAMLSQQLDALALGPSQAPASEFPSVVRDLGRLGLQVAQVRGVMELVRQAPDANTAWRHALAHVTNRLPVSHEDVVDAGGIFAFVGPTGVGKTTTIGKLAARYALKHGPENVALITLDSYRIAGHEQLRVFGRILGVTVKELSDPAQLEPTLRQLRRKSLVLIDTAGLRQGIPGYDEQMNALAQLGDRVSNYLVVSTTSQLNVLKAAHHAYRRVGLSGCVLTKLDETASLGESISLVMETQLPVAYFTDGQSVPGDISVARATQLVSRAVQIMKHYSDDLAASSMPEQAYSTAYEAMNL